MNMRGVFKETRFRQPGAFERDCGLWVDRIRAISCGCSAA